MTYITNTLYSATPSHIRPIKLSSEHATNNNISTFPTDTIQLISGMWHIQPKFTYQKTVIIINFRSSKAC